MIFKTSRQANQDIIDLYVSGSVRFGMEQAERYHAGLMDMLSLLADNPAMARLRREFRRPVRLHPYKAHLIAYVEDGSNILVVRVLHGRQDWESLLS
ncbi:MULTISPECIES: type II toxin-antitoxin system RelE/ParE family toxin [Methylorubrum]|uniref:type II toxin-antitoxin system RelE/ParE family toxin n=1 Tax=Methylorubrum TaxID=2282523 RepID=UPI00209D207B|nr:MULTISPECIES: type II toxin-antitoxin system RelE/ParE family toxin [Methylorubrum]MCP1551686.1 toxin ParE1/3/4 [Methylorubrum zatmanii]MCP1556645.1 toxin ParE1/3/4 [Methylorubrum extorquens]MCP1581734.1 toxin ParE1/3/4 [Methylorubrum extorquens]